MIFLSHLKMKHSVMVTMIFLLLFVVSQVVGLYLVNLSLKEISVQNGEVKMDFTQTVVGDRPETTGWGSIAYIIIGVTIGTILLIFLAKKKSINIWKTWFLFAVWLAISIALGVMLGSVSPWIPWILALVLAIWKIYYQNVFIQNITEVLMYAGIAVLLVPILYEPSLGAIPVIALLLLFSVYDAYAVWKSKHMVKMAKFTTDANVFPGLMLSYTQDRHKKTKIHSKLKHGKLQGTKGSAKHTVTKKTGVLGGGDVIFPMLFAGVIMLDLLTKYFDSGITKFQAFSYVMIIVLGATLSLLFLFTYGKKDKFYPAMPFITTGCLLGYVVMLLVI